MVQSNNEREQRRDAYTHVQGRSSSCTALLACPPFGVSPVRLVLVSSIGNGPVWYIRTSNVISSVTYTAPREVYSKTQKAGRRNGSRIPFSRPVSLFSPSPRQRRSDEELLGCRFARRYRFPRSQPLCAFVHKLSIPAGPARGNTSARLAVSTLA